MRTSTIRRRLLVRGTSLAFSIGDMLFSSFTPFFFATIVLPPSRAPLFFSGRQINYFRPLPRRH
jgi:hypothetical protein